MEKKFFGKTLALQYLICLFFLLSQITGTSFSPFSDSNLSQPPSSSPPSNLHPSSSRASLRRILLGILFGSLTGAVASIVFLFSIRLFLLFANRTPILKGPVIFTPKISPKSLKVIFSGNDESLQMLGSSPNGKYFKLSLNNEVTVAVKVLESTCSSGSPGTNSNSWKRKVQRELELLAKVSHRNVMSLRAYVRDHDRFSLVYDYISNGSLEDAMKRVRLNRLRLGWELRLRIAIGMAKGLKYLHFEFIPRILHYNLKPTNVLLDEGFEPKLGDCGLARLVVAGVDAPISSCYVAPECFQSCRYTDKSDIYSFGMILSVLLTGKDPSDPFFMEEMGRGGLGPWLRHLQQVGEAREALDKGMLAEGEKEEEMLMAIRIALVCLSDLPADRPSSDELEAMLTQLHSF
ncbi:inactive leucine-rich repeat receptor-like protein kinase CORYNE [Dendrobium catenatum]|uniref:Inactive leucine-rich repeat receptor-like protein kinase CORYNE n=1 Tax=Dendrobium catenatum TaxID=906689 RepID=A0A2I0WHE2_9ASPA|nr:inactive leucine-rich repeat receptor-like protein kinase CORYNE [Dendrobium catenatum]PKU75087.1 Inactive leucine-rich repeat receptor-like protein kinase CORYNE [Dendrobium catenatum]